jgi:hypothetical protein
MRLFVLFIAIALAQNYGTPVNNYQAPAVNYQAPAAPAPVNTYQAPAVNYEAPAAPVNTYQAPAVKAASPVKVPAVTYGAPAVNYGASKAKSPVKAKSAPKTVYTPCEVDVSFFFECFFLPFSHIITGCQAMPNQVQGPLRQWCW